MILTNAKLLIISALEKIKIKKMIVLEKIVIFARAFLLKIKKQMGRKTDKSSLNSEGYSIKDRGVLLCKVAYIIKTIAYVILWTIVSLVSSFNELIPSFKEIVCNCDFSSILDKGDFYTTLVAPMLIWIIAFLLIIYINCGRWEMMKIIMCSGLKQHS